MSEGWFLVWMWLIANQPGPASPTTTLPSQAMPCIPAEPLPWWPIVGLFVVLVVGMVMALRTQSTAIPGGKIDSATPRGLAHPDYPFMDSEALSAAVRRRKFDA